MVQQDHNLSTITTYYLVRSSSFLRVHLRINSYLYKMTMETSVRQPVHEYGFQESDVDENKGF
jgi:hypothetical protein